jgi:hypothetical protein
LPEVHHSAGEAEKPYAVHRGVLDRARLDRSFRLHSTPATARATDLSTKRAVDLRHPPSVGPCSTLVLVLGPAEE